jgi:hypothetical protein
MIDPILAYHLENGIDKYEPRSPNEYKIALEHISALTKLLDETVWAWGHTRYNVNIVFQDKMDEVTARIAKFLDLKPAI